MSSFLVSLFRRSHPVALAPSGQARAAFGALLGLSLCGLLSQVVLAWGLPRAQVAGLIAPMGASAVLLFCFPASPLARPWPVIGGNMLSALIGVACAQLVPTPMLAAPLAGSLAIAVMFLLRCLHPAGAAVAMTAVLGGSAVNGAGMLFALAPVGLNTVLLVLAATLYNRVCGAHPVAVRALHAGDVTVPPVARLAPEMPLAAARLLQAVADGEAKRANVADLMTTGIAVNAARPAGEAAALAARHGLARVPIIDASGRLLGMAGPVEVLGAVQRAA